MQGYRAADLRLCFRICKKAGFLMTHIVSVVINSHYPLFCNNNYIFVKRNPQISSPYIYICVNLREQPFDFYGGRGGRFKKENNSRTQLYQKKISKTG